MTVLTLLLKIILGIVIFLFALLLLILVAPIRYRAIIDFSGEEEADSGKGLKFEGKITYLLILRLKIMIDRKVVEPVNKIILWIFIVPINIGKKIFNPDKKEADKASDSEKRQKEKKDKKEKKKAKSEKQEKNTSKAEIFDKIKNILELVQKEYTKETIKAVLITVVKILKSLLPDKGKVVVYFGMLDNPYLVGEIYSGYCVICPYLEDKLVFVPVYGEDYISIKGFVKGHISFCSMLFHLVRLFLNKNVRLFIKGIRGLGKNKDKA